MGKLRLDSIYIYEMNKIWVDARFKNEASRDSLGIINIKFSLPKEDPRDIAQMEELATAKAEEFLGKMLNLMNDLATPPRI